MAKPKKPRAAGPGPPGAFPITFGAEVTARRDLEACAGLSRSRFDALKLRGGGTVRARQVLPDVGTGHDRGGLSWGTSRGAALRI